MRKASVVSVSLSEREEETQSPAEVTLFGVVGRVGERLT